MIIHSAIRNYNVTIESDLSFINSLLTRASAFFVIDNNVFKLYHRLFASVPQDRLFLFDAREETKTIETALSICKSMTVLSAKRNAWLISFGGGITQDVTGFAANILYRGIHWAFVPTTLLAACDSCIGGKTSLNYETYKNALGTFFPPEEIYICTDFFKTLSDADYRSGLGEVIKFNILLGESGVSTLEQNIDALLSRDGTTVAKFTSFSLSFKKKYIEEDEFDKGVRIFLNFAHTFGHAFETLSSYSIPHGTAVALGTMVANRISLGRGLLNLAETERMERLLKRVIPPLCYPSQWSENELIQVIRKDKKQIDSGISAVLIDSEAKPQLVRDLKPNEISKALSAVSSALKM